ncbi:pilin [Larsenimonas salina]|nr:pilin [Larsenimonas salina]
MKGAQTAYEERVLTGQTPSLDSSNAGFVGITDDASELGTVSLDQDSAQNIRFTYGSNSSSAVTGKYVQLDRNSTGAWSCSTSLEEAYQPKGCEAPSGP